MKYFHRRIFSCLAVVVALASPVNSSDITDSCAPDSILPTAVTLCLLSLSGIAAIVVIITASRDAFQKAKQEIDLNSLKLKINASTSASPTNKNLSGLTSPVSTASNASNPPSAPHHLKLSSASSNSLAFDIEYKDESKHDHKNQMDSVDIVLASDNKSISTVKLNKTNTKSSKIKTSSHADVTTNEDMDDMQYNYKLRLAIERGLGFFRFLPKSLWRKKGCYLPFATHIIDQATDIGVILEFLQIYLFERDNDDCKGINSLSLFIVSIIAFFFYRIVSSIWVYSSTGRVIDVIYQLLDLKMFNALYISIVSNKKRPHIVQRYLQLMEASLEGFPQIIIQAFYVIQNENFDVRNNTLVVVSLIFSIFNVASKIVSEDESYFTEPWKSACVDDINWRYLVRSLIRFLDVFLRAMMILYLWIVLGGDTVITLIGIEMLALTLLAAKDKNLLVLTWIAQTPFFYNVPSNKTSIFEQICFVLLPGYWLFWYGCGRKLLTPRLHSLTGPSCGWSLGSAMFLWCVVWTVLLFVVGIDISLAYEYGLAMCGCAGCTCIGFVIDHVLCVIDNGNEPADCIPLGHGYWFCAAFPPVVAVVWCLVMLFQMQFTIMFVVLLSVSSVVVIMTSLCSDGMRVLIGLSPLFSLVTLFFTIQTDLLVFIIIIIPVLVTLYLTGLSKLCKRWIMPKDDTRLVLITSYRSSVNIF